MALTLRRDGGSTQSRISARSATSTGTTSIKPSMMVSTDGSIVVEVCQTLRTGCHFQPLPQWPNTRRVDSMGKREYPLDIENVGEDIYTLLSKGHHDAHEFMRQVRADGYGWPLGMPKHIWLRCIPPRPGYSTCYVEATKGSRGAFPATQ